MPAVMRSIQLSLSCVAAQHKVCSADAGGSLPLRALQCTEEVLNPTRADLSNAPAAGAPFGTGRMHKGQQMKQGRADLQRQPGGHGAILGDARQGQDDMPHLGPARQMAIQDRHLQRLAHVHTAQVGSLPAAFSLCHAGRP